MKEKEKKLLEYFRGIPETEQQGLLSYAEYLFQTKKKESTRPLSKQNIPRPENENVIQAIKRMTRTYPMIEPSEMMDKATTLMSQHLLHGRDAEEVINELEKIYNDKYNLWKIPLESNTVNKPEDT